MAWLNDVTVAVVLGGATALVGGVLALQRLLVRRRARRAMDAAAPYVRLTVPPGLSGVASVSAERVDVGGAERRAGALAGWEWLSSGWVVPRQGLTEEYMAQATEAQRAEYARERHEREMRRLRERGGGPTGPSGPVSYMTGVTGPTGLTGGGGGDWEFPAVRPASTETAAERAAREQAERDREPGPRVVRLGGVKK